MSRQNVEVVQRTYGEWERGNMRAGVELFDPEIHFEAFMPEAPERIVVRRPEGVAAFMREFLAQWRDFRLVGEEFREVEGDKVFVAGRQMASGRHSGVVVDMPMHSIWTFRNRKVVLLIFERERRKALEAAGLSE